MAIEKWLHAVAKTGRYSDLVNKPQITSEVNVDDSSVIASAKSVKKLNDVINAKANSSHTHTKSQITDMPTSLKNPTALTVQFNGATNKTYDGSSAQTVNITPSAIGASASNHTHTKSQITDMPTSLKNPTTLTVQFNGATNKTYDGSAAQTINITPSAIGASASNHTHDDRYYTETEINNKLNERVAFLTSNTYNFNDGAGHNNIRRLEINGSTLINSPNGNNGGVLFEFVGSHSRWNTQQYNDQSGRMWYRNSSDAYGPQGNYTLWKPWKEVSLNEQITTVPLLNGWGYVPDRSYGSLLAKNGNFGYVTLNVMKSVSNDNTVIANTPYAPSKRISACVTGGATTALECRIEPNGDIKLYGAGYRANTLVSINICYPITF